MGSSSADQLAGMGMVTLAGVIFLYYTTWLIILPFVDGDHDIHQYFLPRTYAIALPLIAGVIALTAIGSVVLILMMRGKKQKTS